MKTTCELFLCYPCMQKNAFIYATLETARREDMTFSAKPPARLRMLEIPESMLPYWDPRHRPNPLPGNSPAPAKVRVHTWVW